MKTESRPQAIHLDIEPQALPKWLDPQTKSKLLEDYYSVITYASKRVHQLNLELSIDVGFYYDKYEISSGNLAEELLKIVDNYIIMSFRDHVYGSDGVLETTKTEVDFCLQNNLKSKIYSSIETNQVTELPKITFFDDPLETLIQEISYLSKEFSGDNCKAGFAIHDYRGFRSKLLDL